MKPTYKDHADFQAAHTLAKYAACYELGPHWKLVRGASVMARLPAAWVRCPVGQSIGANGNSTGKAIRYCKTPRDVRLPADCFWADGLPEGPEYFAEYQWESAAAIELAEAAD